MTEVSILEQCTVVLPAKNEAAGLRRLLPELLAIVPPAQVLVVDDGSDDDTVAVCREHGVNVLSHAYSMGNGAAIKSGARACKSKYIVFMDADGQHDPRDILRLLAVLQSGADMVVGARTSVEDQGSFARHFANRLYNLLASWMTGHQVADLTSGFRVVRRKKFCEFLYLLPNGFSYPTTSTMAFFRAGYAVRYETIVVQKRIGESHIRLLKDGVRFLLIIFRIGTLYSPLKIFFPASLAVFVLGLTRYAYTYAKTGEFTNMSALLFSTALMIFLLGLISEQITALMYRDNGRPND